MISSKAAGTPVDAHVHFHELNRVGPSLDSAVRNFAAVSTSDGPLSGVLLLVESAREQVYETLLDTRALGSWSFETVPGEPALLARNGDSTVAVVCGRQIRCETGVEVLAYGTLDRFEDGAPVEVTLSEVIARGILAGVPWGFGKWMGSRARLVEQVLLKADPSAVVVGDNGGRVDLLPEPKLIGVARSKGFSVLPGSDPFPFGGDESRVGAFGFVADAEISLETPWNDLRHWLLTAKESPKSYGRALGLTRFVFNQVAIQFYNRMNTGAAA